MAPDAGLSQVDNVNPGQDPHRRLQDRLRSAVERRSVQALQEAVHTDAGLGMVTFDQHSQFTGVRAAEILSEPLQLHLVVLIYSNNSASLDPPPSHFPFCTW